MYNNKYEVDSKIKQVSRKIQSLQSQVNKLKHLRVERFGESSNLPKTKFKTSFITKDISIRFTEKELEKLREITEKEGLPVRTFLKQIIKKNILN
jgi:predicted DNA binding CopG/RHH family protein